MTYKVGTKIYRIDKIQKLEDAIPFFNFDLSEGEMQRRWLGNGNSTIEVDVPIGEKAKFIHLPLIVETERRKQVDEYGDMLPRDKRIDTVVSEVLLFKKYDHIFCVIMKRNETHLRRITNLLMKESIWGVIAPTPKEYLLKIDMFNWLLYRFMTDNKVLNNSPLLVIRDILGVDSLTTKKQKTKSRGYEIHDLIGTKASIFKKDVIGSIGLCMQYNKEKIDLLLGASGECDISINTYSGEYGHVEEEALQRALLCHLVYDRIIVDLVKVYDNEVNSGKWNDKLRDSFSDQLGIDIVKDIMNQLGIDKKVLSGRI